MPKKFRIFVIGVTLIFFMMPFASFAQSVPKDKGEQNRQVKYVTPEAAYEMWQGNPKKVKIIDCRTPVEYVYVGHPFMAYNIPSFLWTGAWDPVDKKYELSVNPKFETTIQEKFARNDTLVLICRSGHRSAEAAARLLKVGFTDVYTVINGFEGQMVTDKDSKYRGKRMKNGWKNSCVPWTYRLNPRLIYSTTHSSLSH